MAMAFSKFRRNDPPLVSNGAGFGLPQLSADVVAAGQPAPSSGGFFSEGGAGRNIAGYLGDYLAQLGGARPIYAPVMQQRQAIQQAERQADQQRRHAFQDWTAKQEWEKAHPDPSPIARDVAAFQNLTPEQRAAYGEMQDLKAGPVTVQLPNGFVYSGNRSGLADALGGTAQAAAPTVQNTPAPTLGENGNPTFLTTDQYAATVAQMGQQRTDEWLKRNNIPVGKSVGGKTYYQIGGKWYDNPEGR